MTYVVSNLHGDYDKFTALLEQDGVPSMPVWNALKAQMPSWEEIHQAYNKKRTEKR